MTEHAFEDRLRTSMAAAVEGTSPPPLAAGTKRRVRVRQAALAGAAGLVAVAGTFGVVRATTGGLAADEIPPAAPSGELMDARGSGGTYPCELDTGPGQQRVHCVATGERDDLTWKLGASVDPKHGFCLTLETIGGPGAAGAGSSCNEHLREQIGIDRQGVDGLPMLAYGYVPPQTERLVLEHGADESFELEVYPAPEGFSLDDRYFLVWLPDDAVRLVAYDSAGEVVTTAAFDGGPDGADPERTENVGIGHGRIDGTEYVLDAYGVRRDGREIVCTEVRIEGEPAQEVAPCDATFRSASTVGLTPFSSPRLPGVMVFGGVTSSKNGSVEVVVNGDEIPAVMLDAPAGIEQTLQFFVVFVPHDDERVDATVLVHDRSGEVVEERDVCLPGGDGLSC